MRWSGVGGSFFRQASCHLVFSSSQFAIFALGAVKQSPATLLLPQFGSFWVRRGVLFPAAACLHNSLSSSPVPRVVWFFSYEPTCRFLFSSYRSQYMRSPKPIYFCTWFFSCRISSLLLLYPQFRPVCLQRDAGGLS